MMKKFDSRGFTLIELLVVIAIIGILSSVVLASLNTARGKGADAAIKGNLNNSRAQAELFYDPTGSYDGVCTAGANNINTIVLGAARVLAAANVLGADAQAFVYNPAGGAGSAVCHDTAAGWAAMVSLKSPGTANAGWCVDSRGTSAEATILTANSVQCGA